jgi:putrescine transport system ATP-binding protein
LSPHVAEAQVVIRGLNKSFGPFQALRDVNLSIQRGEYFSLLGSSGCGKTTLLRALAGFVKCNSGEIFIDGKEISALPPYRRPVNMMFQSYALFPHMNVFNNIAFGLRREGLPAAEIRRRVGEALDLIAMPSFALRTPQQLSGGQRQRVGLARALVKRPDVLLLDEPLSALDKKLRESTRQELIGIQERTGVTFVMVTHDQDEALTMSTRIAVMSEGRIVQTGTPMDIYERPETRFVADFVGSINLFDGVVSAVEAGIATVRSTALGIDVRTLNRGFEVGAPVTLAIRPEKIRLELPQQTPAGEVTLTGAIAAQSYIGDKRVYQVRLSDAVTVQVSQPTDDRHRAWFPRHTAVQVGWDMTATTIVGA